MTPESSSTRQATGNAMNDLSDIAFVKRIAVGHAGGDRLAADARDTQALALLNRCLADSPKGRIIAVEKHVAVQAAGTEQVVQQWVCYHVGFRRRPHWLDGID